jgi:hypothetical protein
MRTVSASSIKLIPSRRQWCAWRTLPDADLCPFHYPSQVEIIACNFYALFTTSTPILTKFLGAIGYASQCRKKLSEGVMDVVMDILYVGGIAGFFLLVWALAQACDKLGS